MTTDTVNAAPPAAPPPPAQSPAPVPDSTPPPVAATPAELSAAQAAYEALLPKLHAIAPERLQPVRADLKAVVAAARALADEALALRERLGKLPAEEFAAGLVDELRASVGALQHARTRLDEALSPPTDRVVPAELLDRATRLREGMLRVVRYHFEDDAEVGPVLASLVRKRTGPGELGADLRRLAGLYREKAAQLSADTRHYRADDAPLADRTAEELAVKLSGIDREAIRLATELVARASVYLSGVHAEVRAAVLYLLRREPGAAERLPALEALPAARGRPRKSAVVLGA